jgi:hypothetical protein
VISQLRPIFLTRRRRLRESVCDPPTCSSSWRLPRPVVLLTAGGLLVNSFVRLVSVDLGYDPRDVVSLQVSLPKARYGTPEAHERFYRDVSDRLRDCGRHR